MINVTKEVIIGVSKKLSYFENARVYINTVKSQLRTPCFILQVVEPYHKRQIMDSFEESTTVQVVYIPQSSDNISFELYDIYTKLNYLLEIIELSNGDKLLGVNKQAERSGDELHYFITYNSVLKITDDIPKMRTLESEVVSKND